MDRNMHIAPETGKDNRAAARGDAILPDSSTTSDLMLELPFEQRRDCSSSSSFMGKDSWPIVDNRNHPTTSNAANEAIDEGWRSLISNSSEEGRISLGYAGPHLLAAKSFRPVLVLGPQRSRKTTSIAIPSLLEWDGPAVVTSIRTDILTGTYDLRSKRGRAQVYEPMRRLMPEQAAVVGWNPLDDCKDWDSAIRCSSALTEAGALDLREGEFWYGMASRLLAPLLFAAGANGYTMTDVARWVKTSEEFEVRSLLQAAGISQAIESFEAVCNMESRLRTSIYGTCMAVMRVFDYNSVCESSVSGFRVDDFFDGGANTLYLCAPPDHQQELAPLFIALLRRIIREAYERDSVGERDAPLLIVLDEAANIAPLRNLDTLATTAAGSGIQLVSVFHDLSQMVALYGEARALSIANNHSAMLVLPGNRDPRTADLTMKLVGDEDIEGLTQPRQGSALLRRLQPGTALCLYENLIPRILTLRSSSHDKNLLELARSAGSAHHRLVFNGGRAAEGKLRMLTSRG